MKMKPANHPEHTISMVRHDGILSFSRVGKAGGSVWYDSIRSFVGN